MRRSGSRDYFRSGSCPVAFVFVYTARQRLIFVGEGTIKEKQPGYWTSCVVWHVATLKLRLAGLYKVTGSACVTVCMCVRERERERVGTASVRCLLSGDYMFFFYFRAKVWQSVLGSWVPGLENQEW